MAPVEGRFIEVGGLDGAHYAGKKRGMWEETIPMTILHDSLTELEERRGKVAAWLDTDNPAPFFYEETPERVYQAVVNGAAELAKGEADSEFEVTFVAPDPVATGEEVTKSVETPKSTFDRASVRYDDNGDAINANQPLYREGKFGKAVLVEEGTTNLLQTSNVPAEEVATLTQGKTHTLTTVGGSATISHRKTHILTERALPKDGTDITDKTDTTNYSEKGTFNRTSTTATDKKLNLALSGTDQAMEYGDIVGYDSHGGGTHEGTMNYPFTDWLYLLPPENMDPEYDDGMSDYLGEDWRKMGSSAVIRQNSSSVTIEALTPVAESGGSGLYRDHGSTSEKWTFIFLYEAVVVGTGETGNQAWISTGSTAIRAKLPATNGRPKWGVIRRNGSTYNFFVNGEDHSNLLEVASTTSTRTQFYHQQNRTGRLIIHHATFFADQYLSDYPAGGLFEWSWTSPEAAMPAPFTCWRTQGRVTPLPYDKEPGTTYQHIVEYRIYDPGNGWGDWETWDFPLSGTYHIFNAFPKDRYISGWRFQVRHTFRSEHPAPGMGIGNQRWVHNPGFHLVGDYTLKKPIPLSGLGRFLSAEMSVSSGFSGSYSSDLEIWFGDGPDSENITWVKTTHPIDSSPKTISIPGINKGDSAAGKWLSFRMILATTDCGTSPTTAYIHFQATSTHKTTHTVTLSPVDVSDIGTAVDSLFSASPVTPAGTSVVYERSIDGGQTWEPVANGEKLLPVETDLTGKTVQTRYTMSTTDPLFTPDPGETIRWEIQQPGADSVIPATPETVFRPVGAVKRWQLEAKPYATSWQKHVSKREPENLYFPISGIIMNESGTVEVWAEDSGLDSLRQIFDVAGRFALWRDFGRYFLRMNGEIVATVPANKTGWRFFAMRWSGREAALFVDGEKQWSGTLDEAFSVPESLFYLGSNREKANQWNGLIDAFRISDTARTDGEIQAAATATTPPKVDNHTTYLLLFDDSYQSEPTFEVGGTARTWPVVNAIIERDLESDFQISHDDLGLFVKIKGPFKAGDHVTFISETGKLVINNQTTMNRLTIKSRPFPFLPGANRISASPPGVGKLTATWKERWK